MDLTALTELIGTVPESIWGAITGAILTLVGVWMTNKHNLKQQHQQFEFETVERQRERQVNLRKDVYLSAADAVTGMVSTLSSLLGSDSAGNDERFSRSAETFGAALARVQMVGSTESVRCAAAFQRAFLSGYLTLQKLRYPMMLRKSDIDLAHNARQQHHEDRMRCVELMKEYNLTGVRDPQRWQTIQQQAAFAGKQWDDANGVWMRLVLQQETDRLALTRELAARLADVLEAQAPLLTAIRAELEVSGDAALIAQETEKTTAVGVKGITDLIPVVEAGLEGLRRDVEADERKRNHTAAFPSQ